jgi:hypothetical protein
MLSVVMLSVVMLSVVMPSVVAPKLWREKFCDANPGRGSVEFAQRWG